MTVKKGTQTTWHKLETDGTIVFGCRGIDETIKFDRRRLSLCTRRNMETAGILKTIKNAAALAEGTSAREKFDAMKDIAEWHLSGTDQWERPRKGREPVDNAGQVILALMRVRKYDSVDKAEAFLTKMQLAHNVGRDAVIANLRKNADIIMALAAIKAEAVKASQEAFAIDVLADIGEEEEEAAAEEGEAPDEAA